MVFVQNIEWQIKSFEKLARSWFMVHGSIAFGFDRNVKCFMRMKNRYYFCVNTQSNLETIIRNISQIGFLNSITENDIE